MINECKRDPNEEIFNTYFNQKKETVFQEIEVVFEKNEDDIKVEMFSITPLLLKIINEDLVIPSSDKPELSILFRDFLKTNLIYYEKAMYKHSPLHYSTHDGVDSFNYAPPELYKSSFYSLITSYIWCKHFIEREGYSGVLPPIADLVI